jgi:putative endopeptidase
MTLKFIGAAAIAVMFMACSHPRPVQAVKQDIIIADMDTTVKPSADFFSYANGGWIKTHSIPADEASFGIGEMVENDLREKLKKINEDALAKQATSGPEQQIGDFWYSAMDTASIEKNGIAPLSAEIDKIKQMKTKEDVMEVAAHLHTCGVNVFFDDDVSQDPKHSDVEALGLSQGGLGMPNRDYYFNLDERTVNIRRQYPRYISAIFRLMGADSLQANVKAAAIMLLETKMAHASRKLEDLRDPYTNYHKYAIAGLRSLSPNIDWPKYLKDYMSFHLVATFSSFLSKPFADATFNFYGKLLSGAQQQHPRWRRALDAEGGAIGEELGQLFVKAYFDAKAKARYEQIVENVRIAYKARIEKLDWMADSTKQKAIHKLMAINKKVGYPDKWKDFSALKIDRGPYVLNMLRANEWWNSYEMNKLGKPVDRDNWDMTPQTYNAYYNQSNNEIVLPAAQMSVPGYADSELDDALVYGYTAASTIGHEITHGFDDEGRKYDEHGNLSNWWSATDTAQFMHRADKLVKQFNKMIPIDTLHINGSATLGENLADLGGILIGLDAFKQTETYKKGELIHGETPLQRFFLGYSLGWLMEQRPQRIASQLLTDVHAPAKNRVNGPLPNVPEFYDAFGIKPGDKMYLADSLRVRLW